MTKFSASLRLGALLLALQVTGCSQEPRSGESVGEGRAAIIYGADDRQESVLSTLPYAAHLAGSSAALVLAAHVDTSNPARVELSSLTLREKLAVCGDERFAEQPTAAGCSGTLVAPDLLLTAGHCISDATCPTLRVVFGYATTAAGELAPITTKDVYSCAGVLAHADTASLDYAVLRLDRPVVGRAPAPVRIGDRPLLEGAPLVLVGYPSGLPQKVAGGAVVQRANAAARDFFASNVDGFPSNSGSGVFDATSGELTGILVRGPGGDYRYDANAGCFRPTVVTADNPLAIESTYVQRALEHYCQAAAGDTLCACGNGTCEPALRETSSSCPADCGSACGDGACNGTETAESCYADCGACGNAMCEPRESATLGCCEDCGCPDGFSCSAGSCVVSPGNANADASVNEADLDALHAVLLGGAISDFNSLAADADCDGTLTAADEIALRRHLAGEAVLPCHAVESLALGLRHTCALVRGRVLCFGDNAARQLGGTGPSRPDAASAKQVRLRDAAVQIAAGSQHTCAVDASGAVSCWGSNQLGQLGAEQPARGPLAPVPLPEPAIMVGAGASHTCAALQSGAVQCWGDNSKGQLGRPGASGRATAALREPAVALAAGSYHTCALLRSGAVECWGDNLMGQLGLGHRRTVGDDELPSSEPAVSLPGPARAVRSNGLHSCALLNNGDAVCWGENLFGQLGYATRLPVGDDELPSSMGPVAAGSGLLDLSLGQSRTCGMYDDGSVRCWGLNSGGQLGYGHVRPNLPGSLPTSAAPLALGGAVRGIFGGSQHTCAVRGDGQVSCWGVNAGGQLGYPAPGSVGDDELPVAAGPVPLFGRLGPAWSFVNDRGLEVWSRDEGSDAQSSGIALYVHNGSSATVSEFRLFYSFNLHERSGSAAGVQDHYTPWSQPLLRAGAEDARLLELTFAGRSLAPGQFTSWGQNGGEKVRLHFADWGEGWDTRNDYSAPGASARRRWQKTSRVQLVDEKDQVLYGWNRLQ